jgi:hypothetical protein
MLLSGTGDQFPSFQKTARQLSFFQEELVTSFCSFEKNCSLTPNVLSRTGDQFSSLKRIGCQLPFF